ncbi:MAG TPA: hypothetical protein V6C85_09070 [Allocoleopsis sp.]
MQKHIGYLKLKARATGRQARLRSLDSLFSSFCDNSPLLAATYGLSRSSTSLLGRDRYICL